MFFERHLENLLKHFIPGTTDPRVILNLLPLCKSYVHRIHVDQFLPPVQLPPPPRFGDQSESGSEGEAEEPATDHYQLGDLVAGLIHLEELDLVYGVKDCGMNFEWNLFLFTYRDCHSLAATIKACHTLKVPLDPSYPRVLFSATPGFPSPPLPSPSPSSSHFPFIHCENGVLVWGVYVCVCVLGIEPGTSRKSSTSSDSQPQTQWGFFAPCTKLVGSRIQR
jgi:hypothetical protein